MATIVAIAVPVVRINSATLSATKTINFPVNSILRVEPAVFGTDQNELSTANSIVYVRTEDRAFETRYYSSSTVAALLTAMNA